MAHHPNEVNTSQNISSLKASLLQEVLSYLTTNKSTQFLTEICTIYSSVDQKNRKGPPPDVNIEKEIVDLLSKKENKRWQTKFTMACLVATKAIFYKPQCRTAMQTMLNSAKMFGNSTAYSAKIDRDYISLAWHYFLDNRISLEKMEELLQDWDANNPVTKYDYHNFNGMATVYSLDTAVTASPKKTQRQEIRCISPSQLFEPSAKVLKDVAILMLACIDSFPILQKVDLHQVLVTHFIKDLLNHTPLSTLKFARVYPEKISMQSYRKMLDMQMQKDDGWEFVAQNITQIYDMKARRALETTGTSSYTTDSMIASVAHSLSACTMPEYTEFMQQILQRAVAASTTNSMRAAVNIADKLDIPDISHETRRLSKILKFRQLVIKDKWMIAAQMSKDITSKIMLYDVLVQEGKYAEAKRWADMENLHEHVSDIDPTLIEQQLFMQEMMYLPYPAQKVPVTMVDTLGKLFTLARRLDLSLDSDTDSILAKETTDLKATESLSFATDFIKKEWMPIEDPSRKYISLQDMLAEAMSRTNLEDTISALHADPATVATAVASVTRNPDTIPRTSDVADIQVKNIGAKRLMPSEEQQAISNSATINTDSFTTPVTTSPAPISYAQKVKGITAVKAVRAKPVVKEPISHNSSTKSETTETASKKDNESDKDIDITQIEKSSTPPELNSAVMSSASIPSPRDTKHINPKWPFRHMVGIDIEWHVEVYRASDLDAASIVQLALPDHVYILDMQALSAYKKDNSNQQQIDQQLRALAHFLRRLFDDPNILKLVFSYSNSDETVLQRVPGGFLHGISRNAQHIFDMKRDYVSLAKQCHVDPHTLNSLSDYCDIFLGRPLNKGERMSGWNNRPLTTNQLNYAALDAHSLLAILDVLLSRAGFDLGLNIFRDYYEMSASQMSMAAAGKGNSRRRVLGKGKDDDTKDLDSGMGPPLVGGMDSTMSTVSVSSLSTPAMTMSAKMSGNGTIISCGSSKRNNNNSTEGGNEAMSGASSAATSAAILASQNPAACHFVAPVLNANDALYYQQQQQIQYQMYQQNLQVNGFPSQGHLHHQQPMFYYTPQQQHQYPYMPQPAHFAPPNPYSPSSVGHYPVNGNYGEVVVSPMSSHRAGENQSSAAETTTSGEKSAEMATNNSAFFANNNDDSHSNAHVAAMQHAAMMAAPYMFTSGMPLLPPGSFPYPSQSMEPPYLTTAGSPHMPWGWPYFPVNYHHPYSAPPPPTLHLPMNTSSKCNNGSSNSSTPLSANRDASSTYQHQQHSVHRNNSNNSFHSNSNSGKVCLNVKGVPIAPTLFTDASPLNAVNSSNKLNRKDSSPVPPNNSLSPSPSPTHFVKANNNDSNNNNMEPSLESLPIFTSEMKIAIPSSGPIGRRGGKGSRLRLPPFLPPNNPSNNGNHNNHSNNNASSTNEGDNNMDNTNA